MVAERYVVNTKAKQWQENYDKVLAFAEKHNHLRLSHNDLEERRLAGWLSRQKSRTRLSLDEKEKLKTLEKYFDNRPRSVIRAEEWNRWFEKMIEYKAESGDFVVSKYDLSNQDLRRWIDRQRKAGRVGKLSDEQKKRLEEVGFVFKRCKSMKKKNRFTADQEKQWDKMYELLCLYHKENGNCDVPFHDDTFDGLATWVSAQRGVCRKGSMDDTRKVRLDALNFSWNIPSLTKKAYELSH